MRIFMKIINKTESLTWNKGRMRLPFELTKPKNMEYWMNQRAFLFSGKSFIEAIHEDEWNVLSFSDYMISLPAE